MVLVKMKLVVITLETSLSQQYYIRKILGSKNQHLLVTAGMSKVQIQAAIETSREQGWSELACSNCQEGKDALIWEELKKIYPSVFKELIEDGFELELGRLIAEGGQGPHLRSQAW